MAPLYVNEHGIQADAAAKMAETTLKFLNRKSMTVTAGASSNGMAPASGPVTATLQGPGSEEAVAILQTRLQHAPQEIVLMRQFLHAQEQQQTPAEDADAEFSELSECDTEFECAMGNKERPEGSAKKKIKVKKAENTEIAESHIQKRRKSVRHS